MEGKQFSSSRGVVIYVRDMLERYQPDALRYFISAAGPENQDSNFTWAEFVRRTNDELVAGWGNLVNRTATMVAKSFGEIPRGRASSTAEDQALLDTRRARRSATVGELIGRHRQKAALAEAMRTVAEVNKYVSDSAPWKLKGDDERERLGTILHVTAQAVADCNVLLSPFLPHSANAVDLVLGGAGDVAPMPEIREVEDLDGGPALPDPHRRLLRLSRPGSAVRSCPARRSTSRCRCSPSSTRRVVDEELARLGGRPGVTLHPQAVAALALWAQGPSVDRPRLRAGRHRRDARRRPGGGRAGAAGAVDRVEDVDADGVPCRLYVPDGAPAHDGVPARRRLRVRRRRHPRRPVRGGSQPHRLGGARRRLPAAARAPVPRGPRRRGHRAGLAAGARRRARPRPRPGWSPCGDSAGGNLALVAALRNPERAGRDACWSTRSSTRPRRSRRTPPRTAG